MSFKNYTTTVPVTKTLAEIEQVISLMGAHNISKQIADRRVYAVQFQIMVPMGHGDVPIVIRLPVNTEAFFKELWKDVRRRNPETQQKTMDQAERAAWRLAKEWLEVQWSLIRMRQTDFLQVFLPYVWDESGQQSFYEGLRSGGFKALPAPRP
jgi:hypothetical protein